MIHAPSVNLTFTGRSDLEAYLRIQLPPVLTADTLAALDPPCFKVGRADKPAIPEGQRAVLNSEPTHADGVSTLGWTLEDIPQEVIDADAASLNAALNDERERRLALGSSFTVTGVAGGIPLTGRPFDQSVYLGLVIRAQGYKAAGVTAPILTVRDGDDTIHTLTPDQMIELVSAAMFWVEAIMARSWAMKDGTDLSGNDPAGPDFSAGIPSDFTNDTYWSV